MRFGIWLTVRVSVSLMFSEKVDSKSFMESAASAFVTGIRRMP